MNIVVRKIDRRAARTPWLALGLILIGSWFLLHLDLEGKSLWTDELFTARWAHMKPTEVIQVTAADFHPPLYFLLVNLWTKLIGASDFALRWPSIVAAWLSIPLLYRLARALGDGRTGLFSAALWGLTPVMVLYARMARYYSLSTLLGLSATILCWHSLKQDRWSHWFGYTLCSSAAIYTFYLTGLLLPVHGWLSWRSGGRRGLTRWLVSVALLGLTLLPWSGVVLNQSTRTGTGAADLAFSPVGLALKGAYPAYALTVGESLFPWHPLAVAGGMGAVILGILGILRWRERGRHWLLLALLVFPFAGMVLATTLISPRTPFVSMPARTLFAAPFFYLILGAGLETSRTRLKWVTTLALAGAWAFGLANYYLNQQFLNPIYLTPAREMADQIVEGLEPGDVVVSPDDSGLGYYYRQSDTPAPHFNNSNEALAYLQDHEVERVWLVALGRDQTRQTEPNALEAHLQSEYRVSESWGYVPQDPTYRAIKSHLLGRPAYEYRAILTLYVRSKGRP